MMGQRFWRGMTLGEAREVLQLDLDEGVRCPCCDQHAQMYRWSLYGTAVQALALYYRFGRTGGFVHSGKLKEAGHKGQGDASRLAHWGLLEQESVRRPDGGRSGWWRVTDLGERFLRGEATIPKYVWVYDGKVRRFEGPEVSVRACLGKRFDYDAMMAGAM